MTPLKKKIKNALLAPDFDAIAQLSRDHKKVFSILISLAYDKEDIVCWRAIEAMGKAAAAVAEEDPALVRNIIQRLLWSLCDESGGIAWSAPEMLGEIVSNVPRLCTDIPPLIISLSDEPIFLKGVLWAVGRLIHNGIINSAEIEEVALHSLGHEDPAVRGLALYVTPGNKSSEVVNRIREMVDDEGRFRIYRDHELVEMSVGEAAREALGC